MIHKTFDPGYHRFTQTKQPNYIWAVERYFNTISKDLSFEDSTIEQEYGRFINNVFPFVNPNLPIADYDSEEIKKLLDSILIYNDNNISQNTLDHSYRRMVARICKYFNAEFVKEDDPLWGSCYNFKTEELDNYYLSQLTKSFTIEEEKLLTKELLKDPLTNVGEKIGISTSYTTGVRENECCGLNYGDIIEMKLYKNIYKLRAGYQTTTLHSSSLKAGGKTENAPRYIVLIEAYIDYILKRMDYLNSILAFPITDENGTFNSVLDLPIACKGTNYTQRCKSEDLAKVSRKIFKDVLHMDERRVAKIDEERLNAMDAGIYYKDVTLYAMRRNFDTHCYNLDFSSSQIQYIMGHEIQDKRFRRCDFVDEDYLLEMYNLLKEIPINKYYFD